MGSTAVHVRFEGLSGNFLARKWRVPNHTAPFKPFPTSLTSIVVPRSRSLFINRTGDKRRVELTLDEAKTWGIEDQADQELIFAKAQCADRSNRFCLRMLLNAEHSTSDVRSNTFQVYLRLVKDAKFHATHLADFEGLIVPLHYGIITQWAGTSWRELAFTRLNTEANRIVVCRAFEGLHDHGIDHGGLFTLRDFRHAIIDVDAPGLTDADRLNGKAPCYIVDFSNAQADHHCARKLPILPYATFPWYPQVGCIELTDALVMLDLVKCPDARTAASEALAWHAEYSKRYPELTNSDVMIAQRARLYPDMPPLYDAVLVSFESDDLYARAIITRSDEEKAEAEAGVDGSLPDSVTRSQPR
ncbi:hypothetical protein B0H17DRAFT_1128222 [Mycena rosella]|uniref:Protein kinase domain-containing protein n=1 Tax=Mycena rosella TaxID=1033263 RepID=A0AAD7DXU3_MYCRO|nr:hypothetical protein B0H17DRAFT_1128222 [Mycena rosella]